VPISKHTTRSPALLPSAGYRAFSLGVLGAANGARKIYIWPNESNAEEDSTRRGHQLNRCRAYLANLGVVEYSELGTILARRRKRRSSTTSTTLFYGLWSWMPRKRPWTEH
jgi:hypothetical protein